jgi:ribosomal protein S12 methylthiotransferase accessory factor YcaO
VPSMTTTKTGQTVFLDPATREKIVHCLAVESIERINPPWICVPTYLLRRKLKSNEYSEECGKGVTDSSAEESALFEAVERYSAEPIQNGLIEGSFSHLKSAYNLLPPAVVSNNAFKDSSHTLSLHWCQGHDILHDHHSMVDI